MSTKHRGTLADKASYPVPLILRVIGARPRHIPYLAITHPNDGPVLATVDSTVSLRALAHATLRAIGDEA